MAAITLPLPSDLKPGSTQKYELPYGITESPIKIESNNFTTARTASATSAPSTKSEFVLNYGQIYKLKKAHLKFNVTITSGGDTNPSLSNGAWTIIKKISWNFGGGQLYEISEFNLLRSFKYITEGHQLRNEQEEYGVGSRKERIAWAAASKTYYVDISDTLDFDGGLFITNDDSTSREVKLVVEYDAPANCMECDSGTSSYYSVDASSAYLIVPMLHDTGAPGSTRGAILNKLVSGAPYPFHIKNVQYYSPGNTASSGTSITAQFEPRRASLKELYLIFRHDANVQLRTTLDKFEKYERLNCSEYMFRIKNVSQYDDEVVVGSNPKEAYERVLQALGRDHIHSELAPLLTYGAYKSQSFILGHSWHIANKKVRETAGYKQESTQYPTFYLTLSSALSAEHRIEFIAVSDATIEVTNGNYIAHPKDW